MAFKRTHNDLYAPDESYSTHLLNRLQENGVWVRQNRGSHTALAYESYNNDDGQKSYERPMVSVSGWANFLTIPWYVQANLDEIHVRIYCRISNGGLDANYADGKGPLWEDRVGFRAGFSKDLTDNWGDTFETPFRDTTTSPPEYGWVDFTYYVDPTSVNLGTYDRLCLAFYSYPPHDLNYTYGSGVANNAHGLIWSDPLARQDVNRFVQVNTTGKYAEASTTNAPVHDANEITCTALLSHWGDREKIVQWLDHTRKGSSSDDDNVYVWPVKNDITEVFDGEAGVNYASKWYAPYVQIRAVEIWEVYK